MMLNKGSVLTWLSFVLLWYFLGVGMVLATAETVSVPAGQAVSRSVDLHVGDEVFGRISVIGSESGSINFSVVGPDGQVVLSSQDVRVTDFRFVASEGGTFRFFFDNSLSLVDKSVSFHFDVRRYWFGLPQEFVLMLIVVFLGVLLLVIYAFASKR